MFRTYPEAELPLFTALDNGRSFAWSWLELDLNATYFVARFYVIEGEGAIIQTFLYSNIHDALARKGAGSEFSQPPVLIDVSILAPNHVHGGEGYWLARLKAVKASVTTRHAYMFILDDGTLLLDTYCTPEILASEDFETIVTF